MNFDPLVPKCFHICRVINMFKSLILLQFSPLHPPLILCFIHLHFVSLSHVVDVGNIMALLQWITSCRHQLIIQGVDLEIPFSTLELACLNDKFFVLDDWLSSLVVVCVIPRVFNFSSFFTLCGLYWTVPWEPLALLVVSLALVNGLHHRPVIKRFSFMLDFSTSIPMLEFVLWLVGFKTQNSNYTCSGCVDWFVITWIIDGWLQPYLSLHGWLWPYLYHYHGLISWMATSIP